MMTCWKFILRLTTIPEDRTLQVYVEAVVSRPVSAVFSTSAHRNNIISLSRYPRCDIQRRQRVNRWCALLGWYVPLVGWHRTRMRPLQTVMTPILRTIPGMDRASEPCFHATPLFTGTTITPQHELGAVSSWARRLRDNRARFRGASVSARLASARFAMLNTTRIESTYEPVALVFNDITVDHCVFPGSSSTSTCRLIIGLISTSLCSLLSRKCLQPSLRS